MGAYYESKGTKNKNFFLGSGEKTNNEIEWLALIQGLEMIDTRIITRLLIFGDSRQVILKMKT